MQIFCFGMSEMSTIWNCFVKRQLCINLRQCMKEKVAQLCPTLCDPMDCSLPHSSIHGIFQARVLVWVAISFSRGSSWPGDRTQVSRIVGRRFTIWATREALKVWSRVITRSDFHFTKIMLALLCRCHWGRLSSEGMWRDQLDESLSFYLTPSQLGSVVQSFMYKEGVCIIWYPFQL